MPTKDQVRSIYTQPLKTLLSRASAVHQRHFPENQIQLSSLLSIKTGGCPENCAYCPQSAHYLTGLTRTALMELADVTSAARAAKASGATRFCMGAAWREVNDGPQFDRVIAMVREVRGLGLEVCCTLGLLSESQAIRLKEAGLHAYNHNIDSSRRYYREIISTRTYDDRLRTIDNVRKAGLTVCTGGIIGMGECDEDRIEFLLQLASLEPQPESVTINSLIPISGTPLEKQTLASAIDLARVIATARCLMPRSMIRLSAGRKSLSEEGQFLCYLAGANSVFLGETLLTSENPTVKEDQALFEKLGLTPVVPEDLA